MAEDMLELGLEASHKIAGNDRVHDMYSTVKQKVRGGSSNQDWDEHREREDDYYEERSVGERRQRGYDGQMQPYGGVRRERDGYPDGERNGERYERSRRDVSLSSPRVRYH